MSDLRLAFASTAIASLDWAEFQERPVDRVAASGRVDDLGLALWKAKYQRDTHAALAAHKCLKRVLASHYRSENEHYIGIIGAEALYEYLQDWCLDCGGLREMMIAEVKHVCPTCHGTGARRHSDTERSIRMDVSLSVARVLGAKITWTVSHINGLDKKTNYCMNIQLERFEESA